jgi:opacity protein-like surface antigen
MFRLNLLSATAVAVVIATGAHAADMPVYYEPEPQQEYSSWYLRGDIGATFQISDDLDSPYFDVIADLGGTVHLFDSEWAPSWFIGGGVGYRINDSWRVDVTGEYRFASDFSANDAYDSDNDGTMDGTNDYDGKKEEAVFLFNAYYDFESWGMVTPYVGAGVGAAWIKISDFTDTNGITGGFGLSDSTETWNFAAALYAGATVDLNEKLKLDFGYRFLYMGDAKTEDLLALDGSNDIDGNTFHFDNIMSHDLKVGLRYAFY